MSHADTPPPFAEPFPLSVDERYRVLAESAPDAIVTIDERGLILSINPATERIFGYRADELLGESITRLMPERMRSRHTSGMLRYLRTGERKLDWQGVQVPGLTREGREFPMEVSFGEFIDGGRHIFSGFMRDVSERTAQRALIEQTGEELKAALTALERRVNEAEEARRAADDANAAKAQFLRTMSHELRTPLNAIGGFVDLLELGVRGPITEAQREDLRRIRVAHARLLALINDVLNFARLEEGRVQFVLAPVRVASMLCTLGTMLEPQLSMKSIEFQCDPGSDQVVVIADEEKVGQILLNLLSNAVKFTPVGGRIHVDSELRDELVLIRVRDNGPGIPATHLETVFKPFVQVDATLTRAHEGTGLGLSISRELACGMGGDLTVESREGDGATFTLTLPAVR